SVRNPASWPPAAAWSLAPFLERSATRWSKPGAACWTISLLAFFTPSRPTSIASLPWMFGRPFPQPLDPFRPKFVLELLDLLLQTSNFFFQQRDLAFQGGNLRLFNRQAGLDVQPLDHFRPKLVLELLDLLLQTSDLPAIPDDGWVSLPLHRA